MVFLDLIEAQEKIIQKAMALGATTAGFADIEALKSSPSHQLAGENVDWPEEAKSILVATLEHPLNEPELDYWYFVKDHTPGNRQLSFMMHNLANWLKEEYGITGEILGYQEKDGSVFLKDAALLAGLGVIGKNNLFITPDHGPRVRMRAMFLDALVPAIGPIGFSPCENCHQPCIQACPQDAFCSDNYSRDICSLQMRKDEENEVVLKAEGGEISEDVHYLVYCRACEAACPIGR